MLLKEKLLPYRPDLVIIAINSSDIEDVKNRGGRERFLTDGTLRAAKQPPSWEWLYGLSFIFRHVLHDALGYDSLFFKRSDQQAEAAKAIEHIDAAVTAFVQLGRERGFQTLIVLHPTGWEASRQQWSGDFANLVTRIEKRPDVDVVNMLAAWKSKGLLDNNLADKLYWPIDGHNNATGYAAFGEVVAAKILDSHVLDRK